MDFSPDNAASPMVITGERTVPDVWHENYWFRRHEVVYLHLADLVAGEVVLEAGCGEGYGAHLLSRFAASITALDYDAYATDHVRLAYPAFSVLRGNLVQLPFADECFDVVVSLQTIEHVWNQPAFIAECLRVLRPGGRLVLSTPNVLTFPPGNIYHSHELTAVGLRDLVAPYAAIEDFWGLRHGPVLSAWENRHGSIVDQQIATPHDDWNRTLIDAVTHVEVESFVLTATDLDESLDLVMVAVKSASSPAPCLAGPTG